MDMHIYIYPYYIYICVCVYKYSSPRPLGKVDLRICSCDGLPQGPGDTIHVSSRSEGQVMRLTRHVVVPRAPPGRGSASQEGLTRD